MRFNFAFVLMFVASVGLAEYGETASCPESISRRAFLSVSLTLPFLAGSETHDGSESALVQSSKVVSSPPRQDLGKYWSQVDLIRIAEGVRDGRMEWTETARRRLEDAIALLRAEGPVPAHLKEYVRLAAKILRRPLGPTAKVKSQTVSQSPTDFFGPQIPLSEGDFITVVESGTDKEIMLAITSLRKERDVTYAFLEDPVIGVIYVGQSRDGVLFEVQPIN